MGKLVKRPLQGHATKYNGFFLGTYVDQPAKSHWALLTKTVIEGSRNKRYEEEQIVLDSYSQKTGISYEVPTVLDATVCNLMEYLRSGAWLYSGGTYTWCQEKHNAKNYLVVGGGFSPGLFVGNSKPADKKYGVGGLKKF